jgi:2-polyprenyl-3-methyl-5-hydroxy-6-metoxy-1,4-benzoquinol methylase
VNERPEHGDTDRSTDGREYAERLRRLESSWWRRLFNVQAPYRWNIRRLRLGRTLDVGCGLGRNLAHLGGNGVGVDHNAESVKIAVSRGLTAFTVEEFHRSEHAVPGSFDSMLLAHVVEHMDAQTALSLLREYLVYLKPSGTVCFITPQERGYRTDKTHVRFVDFDALSQLASASGVSVTRHFSFPFPRFAGRYFPYNEFVLLARKPA